MLGETEGDVSGEWKVVDSRRVLNPDKLKMVRREGWKVEIDVRDGLVSQQGCFQGEY